MEELKELVKNWLSIGAKHPYDDERLYEIVIQSYPQKIDIELFEEVCENVNSSEEAVSIYKRYEDLYGFLTFLKK